MKTAELLTNLGSSASNIASSVLASAKEHSPELLLITGTVSVLAGTVIACKATLKAKELLEDDGDFKKDMATIKTAREQFDEETYTKQDYAKDLTGTYTRVVMSMAKLYLPAVLLIGLGIGAIFASNVILRTRCASLAAAYATVDGMFKRYRKNVIEKYGAEVDEELRYGIKKEKIEVEETDPETGKTKKVKKEFKILDIDGNTLKVSDYARFFDKETAPTVFETDIYGKPDNDYNTFMLNAIQKEANIRLRTRGFMFLNDVYDMLGIERSIAGQQVGWIYDKEKDRNGEDQVGDGVIDFGIRRFNQRVFEGIEEVILLDFNVDGPILNRLKGTICTI